MSLAKQAKVLSAAQALEVLVYLATTRHSVRNRVIFLLSVKAGLRAKEIVTLTWAIVTDAEGRLAQAIHLTDAASKGRSGRVIPMNNVLKIALEELKSFARLVDGYLRGALAAPTAV
jgi:integrase